jgi:hypothetical protein
MSAATTTTTTTNAYNMHSVQAPVISAEFVAELLKNANISDVFGKLDITILNAIELACTNAKTKIAPAPVPVAFTLPSVTVYISEGTPCQCIITDQSPSCIAHKCECKIHTIRQIDDIIAPTQDVQCVIPGGTILMDQGYKYIIMHSPLSVTHTTKEDISKYLSELPSFDGKDKIKSVTKNLNQWNIYYQFNANANNLLKCNDYSLYVPCKQGYLNPTDGERKFILLPTGSILAALVTDADGKLKYAFSRILDENTTFSLI